MKDPTYTEDWVDALALRIRLDQEISRPVPSVLEHLNSRLDYATTDTTAMPTTYKFTRSSTESLVALRKLPPTATILLFTPVLRPAGRGKAPTEHDNNVDPFEVFGRELSQHHSRVRHVPYVPKVGFTETHDAWVSKADAVFMLVCEPDVAKHESMSNQMDFAENALDAIEGKEANAAQAMVLVQCGGAEYRPPVDAAFMNVIESTAYEGGLAKNIANAILRAKV